jgi:hypothetical protein
MAIILILLANYSSAASIDGYYAKLVPNCYVGSTQWECDSPVEEGFRIKQRDNASFYLWVMIRGDNGHFCKYTGIAYPYKDRIVSKQGDCKVTITISNNRAGITSTESCTAFCGARANLSSSGLKKKISDQRRKLRLSP